MITNACLAERKKSAVVNSKVVNKGTLEIFLYDFNIHGAMVDNRGVKPMFNKGCKIYDCIITDKKYNRLEVYSFSGADISDMSRELVESCEELGIDSKLDDECFAVSNVESLNGPYHHIIIGESSLSQMKCVLKKLNSYYPAPRK